MNRFTKKFLAVEVFFFMALTTGSGVAAPDSGGIPVADGANLQQTVLSAVENVAQTLKQIQQYQTQLQQYENMIQNTAAPSANIWDQATVTMNQLRGSIDTLNYYKNSLGSTDAYLGKFKDTNTYRNSPCYSPTGCTAEQWAALGDSQRLGSEAQKKATDALFRGLSRQQDALQNDASQLQRLQASAQGATGQMQAIGYANQLASHQANQLLQIRGLLIAQQNVIATRNQVLADREALQQAASEKRFSAPPVANRTATNNTGDKGF
jgi:P-type conjugative transfer protein TrbJ